MADIDVEREHSKAAETERNRRVARGIWREWSAAGYTRRAHLTGLTASGEACLLADWMQSESDCRYSPRPFATWLAAQDIWDVVSEAQRVRPRVAQ